MEITILQCCNLPLCAPPRQVCAPKPIAYMSSVLTFKPVHATLQHTRCYDHSLQTLSNCSVPLLDQHGKQSNSSISSILCQDVQEKTLTKRLSRQNQHELETTHVITTKWTKWRQEWTKWKLQRYARNCSTNCTLKMCSVQLNNSLFTGHFVPSPPSTKRI